MKFDQSQKFSKAHSPDKMSIVETQRPTTHTSFFIERLREQRRTKDRILGISDCKHRKNEHELSKSLEMVSHRRSTLKEPTPHLCDLKDRLRDYPVTREELLTYLLKVEGSLDN